MKITSFLLSLLYCFSINAQTISFTASDVAGENLVNPTCIQFGPDGRLYVTQQDGTIFAYTVVRNGPTSYSITNTETILLVKNIPNHYDDGTVYNSMVKRQVTGILVTGTAAVPVLYVSSSDPRIGGNTGGTDLNLDTNSGMISRLTKNGGTWTKVDLVRGLPRSEENHASNGMQLDKVNNILYLAQGGHTNEGAPANNLAFTPEYALSGAILSIDLNVIGNTTFDLPTLNNTATPFGGNDGLNQAILVQGGPVQVYSPGYRNPYDLLITTAGKMYTWDNGPNTGWGGPPTDCTNAIREQGNAYCDYLHYISGPGYYGGHANPTRANYDNTFGGKHPVPASMINPAECNYIIPGNNGGITGICSSTNGICEYTASNFSNALKGDILAASFNGNLYRIELNAAGNALGGSGKTTLASGFGSTPLDVTAQGDNDIFPGTIWAITYGSGNITVFEPSDYSEFNPDLIAYNSADKINGGRLYNMFWANETDFVSPVDPSIDMNSILHFSNFYSCRSCHAYDQKGRYGSYIDRSSTVKRPTVSFINLHDSVPIMTIRDLFDEVKHVGGAVVDSARTADGTNAALGGSNMPDFSKILTDKQVWDIVKFLKEGAFDTEQLYEIATTGNYPTGTKSFSNIGKNGDATAGLTFFNTNCKNCHGANGRDGSLPNGLGGTINEDIGRSIGEMGRNYPYEVQFKAVHGQAGSIMHGVTTATIDDIKNLLKALSDKNNFPDMHPVWYADADGDGFGNVNDTSMALNKPSGYVADGTDCDDANASLHPGAIELPDGLDNNCDGLVDNGIITWKMLINAGGPQYVSLANDTFMADQYYSTPSYIYSNLGAIVNGTDDDVLYRTERYGDFNYNIPVPAIGVYEVSLHFAEVWDQGQTSGARVFNVDIEGSRQLTDYDIYSDAGSYTATTKTFNAIIDDGILNIAFSSIINNAKISALTIKQINDMTQVYNDADPVNGGRLYDKFWATETDFVSPVDPSIDINSILHFSNFYGCRSCHGYDQKGQLGAYIDRAPKVNRPSVANEILTFTHGNSIAGLFQAIKNTGGSLVDSLRTADGTNAALGGNLHPDYGKILTDKEIWDIVKFLKEKAFDTDQLYDITTTGVYPTGSRTFANVGKNGDAVAGALFFSNNCASCHGNNGRDGAYFDGLAIGELGRTKPYEVQHKAVYGNLGTSMYGVSDATIEDIKNLLKALSDPVAYPDLASTVDCNGDTSGVAITDDCGICSGGTTGHIANSDKDACGVCFGNGSSCSGSCVPNEVVSFTLVHAGTAGDIGPLTNGMTINLVNIGSFSIRANTCNGQNVGSVKFILNGSSIKTESVAPYAINGDSPAGNYIAWNPSTGSQTLTATPYTGSGGTGTAGTSETVTFIVINQVNTTDCAGVLNGTATTNSCGICVGGTTGLPLNQGKDCNGDCNGTAVLNSCGVCIGGNTGFGPDHGKDCAGVCNGTASLDGCGICSGGTSGHVANSDKDACGVCFGNGSSCSGACVPNEVVSFSLMHASTAGEIGLITDGMTINLATIGPFSIRANTCNGQNVGSVKFILNGSTVKTESIAPYAINGDSPVGNYKAWNPSTGLKTLTAVPYTGSGGTGTAGISETVTFTVVNQSGGSVDCAGVSGGTAYLNSCGICVGGTTGKPDNQGKDCSGLCSGTAFIDDCGICVGGTTGNIPNASKDCNGLCFGNAVIDACGVCGGNGSSCNCDPLDIASFTLVQAGTTIDIGTLVNGQVINKSLIGPFNIRADVCNGSSVQSVQFKLNGSVFRTENLVPYALNGDKSGIYSEWNANAGVYTLTAIGYSGKSASGTAGAPYTVTFEVVAYSYKMDEISSRELSSPEINIYPNPNKGFCTVEMNIQTRSNLSIEIFTQLGQAVYKYDNDDYLGEFNQGISLINQPAGIYMMRIKVGDNWYIRRVVITRY